MNPQAQRQHKLPPPPPRPKPSHLQSTATISPPEPPHRSRKRGLAWPWNNPASHFSLYEHYTHDPSPLSWLYNWELWRPPSCPDSLEYVPQVRTAKEAPQIDAFLSTLWPKEPQIPAPMQRRQRRHLLGFNEPDVPDQANLTVSEAITLWSEHVEPAGRKFGCRVGAPAVSSAPGGRVWLRAFWEGIGAEGRARVDFLNLHWYGSEASEMVVYLNSMHREFGLPVWVTEFACTRMGEGREVDGGEVEMFMAESVRMLEGMEFVERYAYFGAMAEGNVGGWVGRANGFVIDGGSVGGEGDVKLSRVGKLYCELGVLNSILTLP